MRKNNKVKILILSVLIVLLIPTISVLDIHLMDNTLGEDEVVVTKEFQTGLETALIESYGENYNEILLKNENATKLASEIESNFIVDNSGNEIYPDNYGGMYINDNNDLVVQLVINDKAEISSLLYDTDISNNIDLSDSAIIEYVEYTYNELEEVNNIIIDYFTSTNEVYENFVGNYIDVYSNRVVVELADISVESQKEFLNKVVNSELIEFVVGDMPSTTSSYYAGSAITTTYTVTSGSTTIISGGDCSIGFRAKLNGTVGYVTAGHCFGNMGYTVSSATVSNGTYTKRSYSSTVDAAFVTLGSSHSISNTLANKGYQASAITSSNAYYVSGTVVAQSGAKSGYVSGNITSVSYSTNVKDSDGSTSVYRSGLVKTNIGTVIGDSGGPVFVVTSLTLTNGADLVGIINLGDTSFTGVCPASTIVSSLGVTRY